MFKVGDIVCWMKDENELGVVTNIIVDVEGTYFGVGWERPSKYNPNPMYHQDTVAVSLANFKKHALPVRLSFDLYRATP